MIYPYDSLPKTITQYEMVKDWLEKFGKNTSGRKTSEQIKLAWNCINEETLEVFQELYDTSQSDFIPNVDFDSEKLTKELCDLLWVTYQCGAFFGLPLETAFKRVYDSNMSKLQDDGTPLLREDGKILKGPNYQPVDLKDLF